MTGTTEGMAGAGFYDAHSEYQRAVAETGAALVERCVAATTVAASESTYVIADYGCATGANSISMVTSAVFAVRARAARAPVAVIHNDVATNDFNQLFANLRNDPQSYLRLEPPVLPLASAATFFGVAAPAGAVSLGMSFSAAHWLSTQPDVTMANGFYFCEAAPPAREALRRQAAADWRTFLEARATELVPGGRLLVQMVGTDDEGNVTARRLMRAVADVAGELAAEGKLDPVAVDRYVLAVYARTAAEAAEPFAEGAVGAALEPEYIGVAAVPNPYLDKWRRDHDDDAYARAYTAFVRGFTESSLRLHLFTGSGADIPRLVDEYFDRLEARFRADPPADRFEDWTLTVVAARRSPV